MPDMKLPPAFDGLPVVKTVVRIKKVGDGLSKAAQTDPMTLHHGQEVDVIVRCRVDATTIKPLDSDEPRGPQVAAFDLAGTGKATIVDVGNTAVAELLEAQQKRNDEAAGRPQLPLSPDDDPNVASPAVTENGAKPAKTAAEKAAARKRAAEQLASAPKG